MEEPNCGSVKVVADGDGEREWVECGTVVVEPGFDEGNVYVDSCAVSTEASGDSSDPLEITEGDQMVARGAVVNENAHDASVTIRVEVGSELYETDLTVPAGGSEEYEITSTPSEGEHTVRSKVYSVSQASE